MNGTGHRSAAAGGTLRRLSPIEGPTCRYFSEFLHFFLASDLTRGKINIQLATLCGVAAVSLKMFARPRFNGESRSFARFPAQRRTRRPLPVRFFASFCAHAAVAVVVSAGLFSLLGLRFG